MAAGWGAGAREGDAFAETRALRERFQRTATAITDVVVDLVPLSVYDELGTVRPGAAA